MMKKTKKIISTAFFSTLLLSIIFMSGASIAHAVTDEYTPLSAIPGTTMGTGTTTNLTTYLVGMFKLLIGVAGALAVVMIVIGGIQYMSTDAIYGKTEGRARINQALAGLLLALIAWLILYTINPDLLKINAGLPEAGPATGSVQYPQP